MILLTITNILIISVVLVLCIGAAICGYKLFVNEMDPNPPQDYEEAFLIDDVPLEIPAIRSALRM